MKKSILIGLLLIIAGVLIYVKCRVEPDDVNEDVSDVELENTITYTTLEEAEEKILNMCETSGYLNGQYLGNLVLSDSKTIDYPFTKLIESGHLDIVTSDDGNLRLYSWNTGMGGTMLNYGNICQFRSGQMVYSFMGNIQYLYKNLECDFGCDVINIETIYSKNQDAIYLVETYNRESGNWGYRTMIATQIKGDKLAYVPLFVGNDDEYSDSTFVGVEYTIADWYFRANYGEGWDWLFRYNKTTQTLYVPIADPELSDRYMLYKYDGKYMRYIGEDAGFWLHPSLCKFEFMESLFDTKNYKVRVDKIADQTYRYASWKSGVPMNKEPDIIIYNGYYDEDSNEFVFTNDVYKYIVGVNACASYLEITKNNRTILEQPALGYQEE